MDPELDLVASLGGDAELDPLEVRGEAGLVGRRGGGAGGVPSRPSRAQPAEGRKWANFPSRQAPRRVGEKMCNLAVRFPISPVDPDSDAIALNPGPGGK